MRINEMTNNIQNSAGTGINTDLSFIDGAISSDKDKTTALFDMDKSAVGFFNKSEARPVSGTGKATYTLNEAKGFENKKEGIGEKILDSVNGLKDKNTELVKNLTGDDYDSLSDEGMSLEKFSKERLERAVERIKENRDVREARLAESVEKMQEYEESIDRMALNNSAVTGEEKLIAKLLYEADIPVTKENIEEIKQAGDKAAAVSTLTDSSENYLIKNNLPPTIGNIYKASHSGEMRLLKIDENAWENIKESALEIASTAGEATEKGLENARWLVERDLPVTKENLIYKSDLDALKEKGSYDEPALFKAAVDAKKNGKAADDGLIIDNISKADEKIKKDLENVIDKLPLIRDDTIKSVFSEGLSEEEISIQDLLKAAGVSDISEKDTPKEMTLNELSTKIRLEEVRVSLNIEAGRKLMSKGIDILSDTLMKVSEGIKELEKELFIGIYEEIGLDTVDNVSKEMIDLDKAVDIAIKTKNSLENISGSPLDLYKATFSVRHTITLAELGGDGEKIITVEKEIEGAINVNPISMKNALNYYEESSTEIRRDLGDSIKKAFAGSVDDLLKSNGLALTESNRRAVRILGYNSMEITVENIENMKQYDAKVTGLIEKMTPPVVMTMIRNGINPLEMTIDELDIRLTDILEQQKSSKEQKYSEFLIRMEESRSISENERSAYIGIYRLLYNVEKNDGAAIGRIMKSGRELTFRNLMTEVRSEDKNVDLSADDNTDIKESYYTNSLTRQIDEAFIYQRRLVKESLDVTDPNAWNDALSGKNYLECTVEELHEGLMEGKQKKYENNPDLIFSSDIKANEIVKTMTANTPISAILNSFGLKDSFEKRKAAGDVLMNPDSEDSAYSLSSEELNSSLESYSKFDELLGIKTRMANSLLGQAFSTAINAQAAAELNARVERIEMIRELAGKGHYRLNIEDEEDPKQVNLTLIMNSGNEGTISLQISKEAYNLQAELGMVIMDSKYNGPSVTKANIRFDGKVPENAGFMTSRLKESLKEQGINADNINIASGTRSETGYVSYLSQIKDQAKNETGIENADPLFLAAKSFLSVF